MPALRPLAIVLLRAMALKGEASGRALLEAPRDALRDGDILVVSSKYVAKLQGRVLRYTGVRPRARARRLARAFGLQPKEAEVILREAEEVYGGIRGVLLTAKLGTLAPNAGIDHSNVRRGLVVLQPLRPWEEARKLWDRFFLYRNARLGIIIADSRLTPLRRGTTGVALASCGVPGVLDERGREDLYGRRLRVTFRALADALASAAEALMGEAGEATPLVLIRGYRARGRDAGALSVSPRICLFMRGLKGGAELQLEPVEGEQPAAAPAAVGVDLQRIPGRPELGARVDDRPAGAAPDLEDHPS
ncbi:MAG: hypothetical protein C4339_01385 [Nitrososphaerota archaeon]